jgi:hypothetical protein
MNTLFKEKNNKTLIMERNEYNNMTKNIEVAIYEKHWNKSKTDGMTVLQHNHRLRVATKGELNIGDRITKVGVKLWTLELKEIIKQKESKGCWENGVHTEGIFDIVSE